MGLAGGAASFASGMAARIELATRAYGKDAYTTLESLALKSIPHRLRKIENGQDTAPQIYRKSHARRLSGGRATLYSEALYLTKSTQELRRDLGQLVNLRSTKFETEHFIVELIRRVSQKHDLIVGIFPADQA